MGYTTDFYGRFKLNKKLKEKDFQFLKQLSSTRRMARNVGPEFGVEGEFYVNGGGDFGQADEDNIIDHNRPPATQPSLWLQWEPVRYEEARYGIEAGDYIEWDGGEKFYNYVEWIEYLIDKVLAPRGYVLNGEVEWSGEEAGDMGKINIKDNVVTVYEAVIGYKERE